MENKEDVYLKKVRRYAYALYFFIAAILLLVMMICVHIFT